MNTEWERRKKCHEALLAREKREKEEKQNHGAYDFTTDSGKQRFVRYVASIIARDFNKLAGTDSENQEFVRIAFEQLKSVINSFIEKNKYIDDDQKLQQNYVQENEKFKRLIAQHLDWMFSGREKIADGYELKQITKIDQISLLKQKDAF